MSPWSYSAGKRASRKHGRPSSKVRVYERPDVPGRVFMTRAWILTPSGRPEEEVLAEGVSREKAELLADRVAAERQLAVLEGIAAESRPKPVTLLRLLDQYDEWDATQGRSAKTADDKARARTFWLSALSPDLPVLDLDSAMVERIAASARKRGGWSTRWDTKRLAYLRAAVRWGLNKARLYDVNPLRGLEMPHYYADTDGRDYTPEEAILLATPHPDVDWRVTLAASIICDTGRRITAVLSVSAERDLVLAEERLFVVFRSDFDKGRRSAVMAVSADTAVLVAEALERSAVQESGWLFPEGRVEYDDPAEKPVSKDAMIDALHRAEATLGIEQVDLRAFHGLKRTHVTESWEAAGGDAALVGDVTGNVSAELLKNTYRRFSAKRTTAHVDRVRQRLKDEAGVEDDARETP